jgi:uncharacterized protein YjbI with pentapeptide repeats
LGERDHLMLSLFDREHKNKEAELSPAPTSMTEGSAVTTAPAESTPVEPRNIPHANTEDGLIHADELPSAAETLAEIFPPEPDETDAGRKRSRLGARLRSLWPRRALRKPETAGVEETSPETAASPAAEPPNKIGASTQATTATQETAEAGSDAQLPPQAATPIEIRVSSDELNSQPSDATADGVVAAAAATGYTADEIVSAATESEADLSVPKQGATESVAHNDDGMTGHPAEESAPAGVPTLSEARATKHTEPEAPAAEGAVAAVVFQPPIPPRAPSSDWAFEEQLAMHREWLDSQGVSGKKADFAGGDLEGRELIGVQLRYADLHDASLRAADLLLADLRDACLVRADLEDACLVGTNLEGANLEGATLETAMGLVPRQFAGADLRDAVLPMHIMEFEAATKFERAAGTAFRYFVPMMGASLVSWLAIWKTKDVQLLTDSAAIPLLHSRTAAAALPIAESYLLAPLLLLILYLVFQFHLQRMWSAALELPAVFPDGHPLEEGAKGVIGGLLRAQFRWFDQETSATLLIERFVAIGLAYWMVPFTLLLCWARYLTLQELRGTVLHALFVVVATGVALHATLKTGRPTEKWARERKWAERVGARLRHIRPTVAAILLGAILLFLSAGTIFGVPHDRSRAAQFPPHDIRRWAPMALWSFGFDPYADLTEASISRWPGNRGPAADDSLAAVVGPHLNNVKFRYAQAYGIFLANAHLWRADFEGAFLSDADFRGADLGQGSLRFAIADGARMNHANLNRASLEGADLSRADLRDANLSYASLEDATLVDARLDGANLYSAQLSGATLARANLDRVDLRGSSLDGAHLDHVSLRGAYLWSAKLLGADLGGAQLDNAILIGADLRGANLGGAHFQGTVLNEADLSGTSLEGADIRGALGLTTNQVCSAKSRRGAILDDALQMQVNARCGI